MGTKTGVRKDIDKKAAAYLSKPYTRLLVPDADDGGFVAEVLELPGCVTQGETPEETYANLDDAMTGWIAASLERGLPIPEPMGLREYSGNFALRMSSEMHRAASLRATFEGVSLNQWIATAIAERLGETRGA